MNKNLTNLFIIFKINYRNYTLNLVLQKLTLDARRSLINLLDLKKILNLEPFL